MSNYRDDEVSSIIATEKYGAGWGVKLEDVATAVATIFLVTNMYLSDTVVATEKTSQQLTVPSTNAIIATDSFIIKAVALKQTITDTGVVGDELLVQPTNSIKDVVVATEGLRGVSTRYTSDTATLSDLLVDTKRSAQKITDAATASDSFDTLSKTNLSDVITASDMVALTGGFDNQLFDTGIVRDSFSEKVKAEQSLFDRTTITDTISQRLAATQRVTDTAFAYDNIRDEAGGAWTTNVASFATSRYTNFDFSSITVIRGVPYGTRADGVYRLDGEGATEQIKAVAQFASMDMTGDKLGVPRWVYLSYSSDSDVVLDVTSEQKGIPQSFSYTLPAEPAASGTTGRFTLGRGLRGRYYSFKLSSTGSKFKAVEMGAVIESTTRGV